MDESLIDNDDYVVVLAEPGTTESGFILERRGGETYQVVESDMSTDAVFQIPENAASPIVIEDVFTKSLAVKPVEKVDHSSGISGAFNAAALVGIENARPPTYTRSMACKFQAGYLDLYHP